MPTVPSPYEAELIALIPALKGFAYRFVKNSYDAEDLVQETIARALAHINRFDGQRDGLRRWAFTILRNAFINDYKRAKREPVGAAEDVAIIDVPIGETQYRTIRLHEIEEALSHLSASKRAALSLVLMGASYEDVTHHCKCEIGTVKSRVSRARVSLMKELGEKTFAEAVASR